MRGVTLDDKSIVRFCQANAIRELSLFGSVLRADFRPDSDIDVLVEFEPGSRVTLINLVAMRDELSRILGRKVDLVTKSGLNQHLRDRVLANREVLYVRAG